MTPRCLQFELQMRILDATRDEDALEGGDADHLAECVACQIAATRHRRMISVWRASQIDEAVVRGARERFEAARSEPLASPRWREPMMFAMMGAAFGLALLVVARKIAPRHEASPRSGAVALTAPSLGAANDSPGTPGTANGGPARALTKPALGAPHVDGPRGVTALTDGLRIELKQGESAHVALNDGRTSELVGPCVVEFWSSSAEVGGWRMAHQPPASATAMLANPDDEKPKAEAADRAAIEVAPVGHGNERAWARAAEAMRKDDFAAADAAFAELGRSGDTATRDAARLSRAQLWMAHGRGASVRAVLEDLAARGATPLVRQRATEFLSREIR